MVGHDADTLPAGFKQALHPLQDELQLLLYARRHFCLEIVAPMIEFAVLGPTAGVLCPGIA